MSWMDQRLEEAGLNRGTRVMDDNGVLGYWWRTTSISGQEVDKVVYHFGGEIRYGWNSSEYGITRRVTDQEFSIIGKGQWSADQQAFIE